ncbi:Neprilysin-1 [Araneus ventricosus]|uniref:Neprilysin-1 n=1 Tax=Araneus ventricosus TaxID=182803 RepID=A0A4Y2SNZ3_ARAVE|nr:Neprilysin-1 [Araneus ventricosus]
MTIRRFFNIVIEKYLGRQFDKDGNNINWWEPETDLTFRDRAQCIVDQYGNYSVGEVGLQVNGINTQGENIADNGGIKEAFRVRKPLFIIPIAVWSRFVGGFIDNIHKRLYFEQTTIVCYTKQNDFPGNKYRYFSNNFL